MFPSQPFEARLVAAQRLTPSVRELVFERTDGAAFQFDPGQWVNLVLPLPEGEIKRAYSIASAPVAGSPRFELAVTHVEGGPGSQYLHRMNEGETLRAIGPQGLFTRGKDAPLPSLFIATGTGVTPFRSMIQAALASGEKAPLWLLFGARYEEDILYGDELKRAAAEHTEVRYEVTLSKATEGWTGRRGYVQTHASELVRDLRALGGGADPHVYICGLDRMVSSVKDLLRNELALPRKHVHTERYD
jgi:ferredoxin-NADP reductase